MKYLEGKISLQRGMEKARLPLDLAMREAYFKGSLLDRVTSLEHRVFQVKPMVFSRQNIKQLIFAYHHLVGCCSYVWIWNLVAHPALQHPHLVMHLPAEEDPEGNPYLVPYQPSPTQINFTNWNPVNPCFPGLKFR